MLPLLCCCIKRGSHCPGFKLSILLHQQKRYNSVELYCLLNNFVSCNTSLQSIATLIADFKASPRLYECGHVFFTTTCPDSLFKQLGTSSASKYISTLKELNISFLAYESAVFSLDFNFDNSRSESRKSSKQSGKRWKTFKKKPFTNAMPQQSRPLLSPNLELDQKL